MSNTMNNEMCTACLVMAPGIPGCCLAQCPHRPLPAADLDAPVDETIPVITSNPATTEGSFLLRRERGTLTLRIGQHNVISSGLEGWSEDNGDGTWWPHLDFTDRTIGSSAGAFGTVPTEREAVLALCEAAHKKVDEIEAEARNMRAEIERVEKAMRDTPDIENAKGEE